VQKKKSYIFPAAVHIYSFFIIFSLIIKTQSVAVHRELFFRSATFMAKGRIRSTLIAADVHCASGYAVIHGVKLERLRIY